MTARALLCCCLLLAACSDDGAPPPDSGLADAMADAATDAPRAADFGPDSAPPGPPRVTMPRISISAEEVGILVNEDDPVSVEVAAYYRQKRKIPAANVVKLKLDSKLNTLEAAAFAPLKKKVDAALGPKIQALVLTWMKPYRVHCMGITSAFALGYDVKYCNDKAITGKSCSPTAASPYYASQSARPYTDHKLRPAIMLAGVSAAEVKKVIDRGLKADGTFPTGQGYLVRTTDKARSTRYLAFQHTVSAFNHPGGLSLKYVDNHAGSKADNVIKNVQGVLFYFTGLTTVSELGTNTYRPGALADHLTSFGGQLKPAGAGGQMSILRWLEAGAAGSYGTANEPCNYTQKFPDTRVLLPFYYRGNTLIEAYWKSVQWPGEGVFVGDPLARPWGTKVALTGNTLTISTTSLRPMKGYTLKGRKAAGSPLATVKAGIKITKYRLVEIVVSPVDRVEYELVEEP